MCVCVCVCVFAYKTRKQGRRCNRGEVSGRKGRVVNVGRVKHGQGCMRDTAEHGHRKANLPSERGRRLGTEGKAMGGEGKARGGEGKARGGEETTETSSQTPIRSNRTKIRLNPGRATTRSRSTANMGRRICSTAPRGTPKWPLKVALRVARPCSFQCDLSVAHLKEFKSAIRMGHRPCFSP